MELDAAARSVNRGMVAFDLALGAGALLAPDATLRLLGHADPSPDARALFRRNGPIWLTFAAAHAVAAVRGEPRPEPGAPIHRIVWRESTGGITGSADPPTLGA